MSDVEPTIFQTPFEVKHRREPSASPLDIERHKLIFVGGLHRSGTSIIHRIIREHHEVTGFVDTGAPEDEGQHLQTVYPVAKLFGGAGRFAFHPEARLTEHSRLLSDEARRRLLCEWRPYLDENKTFIVEKSPPNLIRSRFLQALFPGCVFVFVVRHPLAVAMATQKWSRTSLLELVFHWFVAHKLMVTDYHCLHRAFIVRYEDLVHDPEVQTQELYSLLGLSQYECSERIVDANVGYFEKMNLTSEHIELLDSAVWRNSLADWLGYLLVPPFVKKGTEQSMTKHPFLSLADAK